MVRANVLAPKSELLQKMTFLLFYCFSLEVIFFFFDDDDTALVSLIFLPFAILTIQKSVSSQRSNLYIVKRGGSGFTNKQTIFGSTRIPPSAFAVSLFIILFLCLSSCFRFSFKHLMCLVLLFFFVYVCQFCCLGCTPFQIVCLLTSPNFYLFEYFVVVYIFSKLLPVIVFVYSLCIAC